MPMRDEKLDFLRFVGLALVVLAHTDPPALVFQLRNFDVILLVLVSGASFGLSYKGEAYGLYVWKRIKRLLFPAWIFLTVYFVCLWGAGKPVPEIRTLAANYILMAEIDYLWIIRVLLIVALCAPLLHMVLWQGQSPWPFFSMIRFVHKIWDARLRGHDTAGVKASPLASSPRRRGSHHFLPAAPFSGFSIICCMAPAYGLYEAIRWGGDLFFQGDRFFVVFIAFIPYLFVFALGMLFLRMTRRSIVWTGLGFFAVFLGFGLYHLMASGDLVPTQAYKYPPSLYYVAYGMAVAAILWSFADVCVAGLRRAKLLPPVLFVAQNTIWIYLWHIPLIDAIDVPYLAKWPLVFAGASAITWAQISFVQRIVLPRCSGDGFKRNVRMVLTG